MDEDRSLQMNSECFDRTRSVLAPLKMPTETFIQEDGLSEAMDLTPPGPSEIAGNSTPPVPGNTPIRSTREEDKSKANVYEILMKLNTLQQAYLDSELEGEGLQLFCESDLIGQFMAATRLNEHQLNM